MVTPELVARLRGEKVPVIASALLKAGTVSQEDLRGILAEVHGIESANITYGEVEKMALSLVPENVCRRHQVLPMKLQGEQIVVLMANPLDLDAQTDISVISGRAPAVYYLPADRLDQLIDEFYDMGTMVYDLISRFDDNAAEAVKPAQSGKENDAANNAPIIQLGNSIITKAVRMRASDIHIEHEEHSSVVRYRINGMLKNVMTLPSLVAPPLISRIKIMSDLDVAEHYRPQDGRAKLQVKGAEIGLRVSILPTSFGEKAVLRILDKRAAEVPFEKLGLLPKVAARIKDLILASQGIVLVTGPTGSGKTTTLYSILNNLRSEDTNIITVEDPIEYRLEGINQVQINEKQGLTFAGALRSVLRQDPDIILVGEIRDRETADIALQAANTGHMVFSTLHTNDTLSTITRLADMGIERFKMAPSLVAITAQRLVRRLCPDCRKEVPAQEAHPLIAKALKEEGLAPVCFVPGGCAECDETGYKGRLSLIELLELDQPLKDSIAAGRDEAEIGKDARKRGLLHGMFQDALHHLSLGSTTLAEVLPHLHLENSSRPEPPKPPADGAALAPESPAKKAPPQSPAPKRNVLIVDDDQAIRVILRALLQKQGCQVSEAVDGVEALQKLTVEAPDLLILDLNMPNLDGRTVLKSLRNDLGLLDMHVIILTVTADEQSQEEAIRLGADDYVIKPFRPALILARIDALFRRLERPSHG